MKPGLNIIPDRDGKPMEVLSWQDGTRSVEEGTDLASVLRGLSTEELGRWLAILRARPLWGKQQLVEAEAKSRPESHRVFMLADRHAAETRELTRLQAAAAAGQGELFGGAP